MLTAVLTLAVSPDMEGGEMEVDRGGGPTRAEGLQPGDLLLFRSWDAHRSTPVLRGERHILVLELWQGPPTGRDSLEGRPAELHGGRAQMCGPALAADPSSAALLWFCSQAAPDDAGLLDPVLDRRAVALRRRAPVVLRRHLRKKTTTSGRFSLAKTAPAARYGSQPSERAGDGSRLRDPRNWRCCDRACVAFA